MTVLPPALVELHARVATQGQARDRKAEAIRRLREGLFDRQIAFIEDKAREKAALCTRRAGKTTLAPRYLLEVAIETGGLVQYWAITRLRAKQLIWQELKAAAREAGIEADFNETELTCRPALGGEIRLVGADKEQSADRKRGDKSALVMVDEAQLFGSYLKAIVEDIVGPSLMDMHGTLCLMGTPGIVCAGFWYEATRGDVSERKHGFSVHAWSVLDNPHMPTAAADIDALKAKRRWTDDNPTLLREWKGRWVNDTGALVYKYDDKRNGYSVLPAVGGWAHILVVDLGSGVENDPIAASVLSWTPALPDLYVTKTKRLPEAKTTRELMVVVRQWQAELGGFIAHVLDTGGGGKLTAQDISDRWGMAFEAAQKTEKHLHQRLLNDDLLGGLVRCRWTRTSRTSSRRCRRIRTTRRRKTSASPTTVRTLSSTAGARLATTGTSPKRRSRRRARRSGLLLVSPKWKRACWMSRPNRSATNGRHGEDEAEGRVRTAQGAARQPRRGI